MTPKKSANLHPFLPRFPEDFPGLQPDAQIIGFWRPSHATPYLRPDFVLAANLVKDPQPAIPFLFEVALGRYPLLVAQGSDAKSAFLAIVSNCCLPSAPTLFAAPLQKILKTYHMQ